MRVVAGRTGSSVSFKIVLISVVNNRHQKPLLSSLKSHAAVISDSHARADKSFYLSTNSMKNIEIPVIYIGVEIWEINRQTEIK